MILASKTRIIGGYTSLYGVQNSLVDTRDDGNQSSAYMHTSHKRLSSSSDTHVGADSRVSDTAPTWVTSIDVLPSRLNNAIWKRVQQS